jgi:glycosyltransferase involved in cell wall biosynthesis
MATVTPLLCEGYTVGDPMNITSNTGCFITHQSVGAAAGLGLRVAMVTNIPAPYRLPIYEMLANTPGIELHLLFCSGREPDREWDLAGLGVPHVFLRERMLHWRDRFIHANADVWSELAALQPHIVITTGFNPTHVLAFLFARMHRLPHIAMTDGTAISESSLSWIHRTVRRWVYRRTSAFVGASDGSFELYAQYGVPRAAMFKSHLCADNATYAAAPRVKREFDFIFCGRFVESKLPLFAIEVADRTARLLGRRVRLLFVGSGKLLDLMRAETESRADHVEAHFAGFARQAELPAHYASAKLLLFTSVADPWGVVANEACAAGVPVLVSDRAGAAGDLVRDGVNGRVLPRDASLWSEAAAALLRWRTNRATRSLQPPETSPATPLRHAAAWQAMSQAAEDSVLPYSYANAAAGLEDAIAHARSLEACVSP